VSSVAYGEAPVACCNAGKKSGRCATPSGSVGRAPQAGRGRAVAHPARQGGDRDIITGKKTVLDYLLKPIINAKHTALRAR